MLDTALLKGPEQIVTPPGLTKPASNVSTGSPGAAKAKRAGEVKVMSAALAGTAYVIKGMVDNATADILGIEASRNVFAAGSIVRIVAGIHDWMCVDVPP